MWTVSRPLIPQPEVPPSPTATLVCNVSARLAYLPWNLRSRVALSCAWDYMYMYTTCGTSVRSPRLSHGVSTGPFRSPLQIPGCGAKIRTACWVTTCSHLFCDEHGTELFGSGFGGSDLVCRGAKTGACRRPRPRPRTHACLASVAEIMPCPSSLLPLPPDLPRRP